MGFTTIEMPPLSVSFMQASRVGEYPCFWHTPRLRCQLLTPDVSAHIRAAIVISRRKRVATNATLAGVLENNTSIWHFGRRKRGSRRIQGQDESERGFYGIQSAFYEIASVLL